MAKLRDEVDYTPLPCNPLPCNPLPCNPLPCLSVAELRDEVWLGSGLELGLGLGLGLGFTKLRDEVGT